MALNEELVAIQALHNLQVERLAERYGRDATGALDEMSEKIETRIQREVGKNLTPLRRERLLDDISVIVNASITVINSQFKDQFAQLGKYEFDWQSSTLVSLYEQAEAVTITQAAAARAANNALVKLGDDNFTTMNQLFRNFKQSQVDQITNVIANGFVAGRTTREITNEVAGQLDKSVKRADVTAKRIARTGVNHYANVARDEYFEGQDIIVGRRLIAVLDSATSGFCRGVDNTVVLKTDKKYSSMRPPFHPNCRTASTPEVDGRLKGDDDGSGRAKNFFNPNTGKFEPGVGSSKDIFYQQLARMPASAQDAQLGPTLGRAFRKGLRNGTLTPESFAKMTIDKNNLKPLTLEEMKKRDNALADLLNNNNG